MLTVVGQMPLAAAEMAAIPVGAVVPPPASDTSFTASSRVKDAGVINDADSHRPVAIASPSGHRTGPGDSAMTALPPAGSASDAVPQRNAARPDAASEALPLAAGSTVALAALPAAGSLATPSSDQPRIASPVDRAQPADQIAAPLIGVLRSAEGTPTVTVRLQPPELGQVQIRIDQSIVGAAHISITAQLPETLRLLQHDEPRLQQALDQAGVLSIGRTISFQVVAPDQTTPVAPRPDSMAAGSNDAGNGQNGGTWRENEDAPRNFGHHTDSDQKQARVRWSRAGLDITA